MFQQGWEELKKLGKQEPNFEYECRQKNKNFLKN